MTSSSTPMRPGMLDALRACAQPRVAVMLALGFGSGLPFFLTANTLGYWLRDAGTSLSVIGFISWVGLAYSLKLFWAPIIDRVDAPIFGKMGRRRGWVMLAQLLVIIGIAGMAISGPEGGLTMLGIFALVTAFSSATQDIVVDAWRIESAETKDEIGLLSAALALGYRVAVLVSDALILIFANHMGWNLSYGLMAVLMLIGVCATWKGIEPKRADAVMDAMSSAAPLWTPRGLFDAIVGPFVAFFRTHGWMALLMLAMISLYRIPEYVMGPMVNPFYHDIGLSKDVVGSVRASIGLIGTFGGIAAGGFCSQRFGYMRTAIVGVILQGLAIASFAILAYSNGDVPTFAAIMVADNFGTSFAGIALIAYMSSLTSLGYTATQYALLSSAYSYVGKILKGFSGTVVESLSATHSLLDAYAIFFVGAGAIGIPALILCIILSRVQKPAQMTTT